MEPRRWLPVLVMTFILGSALRISWLSALSISLAVLIGLATWWKNRSLDGVQYQRRFHYTRGFPGERTEVRLDIENRKLLPISWLRTQDPWPYSVGPEDESLMAPSHIPDQGLLTNLFSLRWYERARRSYALIFRKRGVYPVGPVNLQSGDIFGIYDTDQSRGISELLTVFPSLVPLEKLDLPAEDPFGDRRSRRRLFEDPNRPMGVREYHPEDSFRRMHWPQTARTGQLQVKVFQPTSGQVMMVCLNVSTFARHWEGVYPPMLEHLVSMAATLVTAGLDGGYRVGLAANGCIARSDQPFRIPPGRTPRQHAALLGALAGVNPVVTAPFERFLMKEVPRVPYGATLLILTAVTTSELAETLLKLKRHERKLTLVSLAKESPPVIPGINTLHLPFNEAENPARSEGGL